MYRKLPRSQGPTVGYEITDKMDRGEARRLAEELEEKIAEEGKINALFDLQSFPYADVGAVWEDIKFDAKHLRNVERVAVVGDRRLEKASVAVADALTSADCRFFERQDIGTAWSWVENG